MHVYLRITDYCNINCLHCYAKKQKNLMSIDTVKRTGKIFSNSHFIFHGGEPLTVPIKWYEEALEYLEGSFSMQSNLVHLSKEHFNFLTKYRDLFNSSIGTSLDFYRIDYITSILENIYALANKGFKVTAILTVDDQHEYDDYVRLIGLFKKSGGYNFKIQLLSPVLLKRINYRKISDTYKRLFHLNSNILKEDLLNVCLPGIPMKLFGGNCAKGVRTVNPDGSIYICPEFAGQRIFSVGDINNPQANLNNVKMFYKRSINLLSQCDNDCYNICEGGCLAMTYWINSNFHTKDPFCFLYKELIFQNGREV